MNGVVIAVSTANRPEILNRCIAAAVSGCGIARRAHWIVVDNSASGERDLNREIVNAWRIAGVKMSYVDQAVEAEIRELLPAASLRQHFAYLVEKPAACRIPGVRNLALISGLSLNPEVLFFIDDDVVHHHEHEHTCFFHWCTNTRKGAPFIATARKRGVADTHFLSRVINVLQRDDWFNFLSKQGISADDGTWYSAGNPLWKSPASARDQSRVAEADDPTSTHRKGAISTQLIGLCGCSGNWLPFPGGYNEDVNWSFLQSSFYGTPLLQVQGVYAQHLPPFIRYPRADAFASELFGIARTRFLRESEMPSHRPKTLRGYFETAPEYDLKPEAFLLLGLEALIDKRAGICADRKDVFQALSRMKTTLIEVKEKLKGADTRALFNEWLLNWDERRRIFSALRRNRPAQMAIRHVIQRASV